MISDNLKMRAKLYLGFGVVLLLLLVIAVTAFVVLGQITDRQASYMEYENMEKFLLAKEIDHLNWTAALYDMFVTGKEFDKQLDPTKCSFGKWYYSFRVTDAEMQAPYKAIEAPHKRLHESALEVKKAFLRGDREEAVRLLNEKTLTALSGYCQVFSVNLFKVFILNGLHGLQLCC